jgi:hypothetical protein
VHAATPRFYAGAPCRPGWYAFEKLLQDWRDSGDLGGLMLKMARGNMFAAETREVMSKSKCWVIWVR